MEAVSTQHLLTDLAAKVMSLKYYKKYRIPATSAYF